jgi:L-ascorbate metabolism protein UlaG (beta-lactamase superfamily)
MTVSLTATRIGHACQLIEIGDVRVLTDPWFTQTATYYQGEPVAASVAALGRVDAVVVSHEHYDHCDLDALVSGGFDLGIPLIGPGTVAALAQAKGFRDVRAIEAWESTTVEGRSNSLEVTAAPALHGVHEVTFVIRSGGRTVFFGGDSLLVPEMDTLPGRFGPLDLAILPTNGLCIRPLNLRQVVMDARQAAELTAALRPTVAVPHHYAFHSGRLGDQMITKGDRDPRHYADAVAALAPDVDVRLVLPGTAVNVP